MKSLQILKNPKGVVNAKLEGSFTMKVYCDQQTTEKYSSFIDELDELVVEEPEIANKIATMDDEDEEADKVANGACLVGLTTPIRSC
jgi:hypothetical protein